MFKLTFKTSMLPMLVLLQSCGGGSSGESNSSIDASQPVLDTIAPVITINGEVELHHEQGTEYIDAGASAQDNIDGNITVSLDGGVLAEAGIYTLTYSAIDTSGNQASKQRIVTVSDTTSPVITLTGNSSVQHIVGSNYIDAGATAIDLVDGNVPVSTEGTVENVTGTYQLTYRATDVAGNVTTASRTITVIDSNDESGDSSDTTPPDSTVTVFANGVVGDLWDKGINAFDSAIGWAECNNDNGAGCPSISWDVENDTDRGDVLRVSHSSSGDMAGLFIGSNGVVNLSDNTSGKLVFDIKVLSGDNNITVKLDCIYPCTSGDMNLGMKGEGGWETVEVSLTSLVAGGLNLSSVNTGIVIWATNSTDTVFLLDNVHFSGVNESSVDTGEYEITLYGAGSISDSINPNSYRCVFDYGNWIYNAGIVEPAIASCDTSTGIPSGTPTKLIPQLSGNAKDHPTPTHKWWGSVPFLGEMTIGDADDAAYITPDPMTVRITNKGLRVMGIPNGLSSSADGFQYAIPDPFSEVFDGIAIANSEHANLDAFLDDYSDASVTILWKAGDVSVMKTTFVHGSPYAYFEVYEGNALIKTLREDSGEKGTFYSNANSLGIWTSVAGNHNNFMVTGEGTTTFSNITTNEIEISNTSNAFTLTYLPQVSGIPSDTMAAFFESKARNVVAKANINYSVNRTDNSVTVSHQYLDDSSNLVSTIAGMLPMHWKNSEQTVSSYNVRSARGVIKFAETSSFDYQIPFVGVLPSLPTIDGAMDNSTLTSLVNDFVSQDEATWNTYTDAYWSGKIYNKVAELIAIADSAGLTTQALQMRTWLKGELANWFNAETDGELDEVKYFVYDKEWSTLLAVEESFMSHQQLNDHHFHYGYFVRAAAEICRVEPDWCGTSQYGPMIELLIRDYAGAKGDLMFPYLRNFDPANGFSWASGMVNFARGNNNESTSEAANAYGAIVLYGLITGDTDLTERGMYLHASTTEAYWEYWNNIDGYNAVGSTENNFPDGYDKITTSIIWGDGAVFSTWFSGAYAHILGIQGLPTNPLTLHVGLHADYMKDYVSLGLAESSNGKPSGLVEDQWRDIWWNLWAMVDADEAVADYESVTSYTPEEGESEAHTYHWLNTYKYLGILKTGTGDITADHPAAMMFENGSVKTYVIYNYGNDSIVVNYSDGKEITASASGFTIVSE